MRRDFAQNRAIKFSHTGLFTPQNPVQFAFSGVPAYIPPAFLLWGILGPKKRIFAKPPFLEHRFNKPTGLPVGGTRERLLMSAFCAGINNRASVRCGDCVSGY
jgi:hypothetical protein